MLIGRMRQLQGRRPRLRSFRTSTIVALAVLTTLVGVTPAAVARPRIKQFPIPSGAAPGAIVQGGDGNLWFVEPSSDNIARLDVRGNITEVPAKMGQPFPIAAGPGRVWYTGHQTGTISVMSKRGKIMMPCRARWRSNLREVVGREEVPDCGAGVGCRPGARRSRVGQGWRLAEARQPACGRHMWIDDGPRDVPGG
jgi:hypothetical protein